MTVISSARPQFGLSLNQGVTEKTLRTLHQLFEGLPTLGHYPHSLKATYTGEPIHIACWPGITVKMRGVHGPDVKLDRFFCTQDKRTVTLRKTPNNLDYIENTTFLPLKETDAQDLVNHFRDLYAANGVHTKVMSDGKVEITDLKKLAILA